MRAVNRETLMAPTPLPVETHDRPRRSLIRQQPSRNSSLWLALRNGQIGGLKFRRQHPVGRMWLTSIAATPHWSWKWTA